MNVLDSFNLSGRRALITGSSAGIGLALAEALAQAGAHVILNGRTASKVDAAAQSLKAQGLSVGTSVFDVTNPDSVRAAVDQIEAEGAIDILVNNAGMQHRAPLEDFPAEAFERLLQTNIASVFHVGQAVARHMIARGRGKIINIASVQTALARPSIAPYTATKGAVGNLTKGMATDWAKHGLNCNAIAPGFIETDMSAAVRNRAGDKLKDFIPMRRLGQPSDIARVALFLAGDGGSYVTGQVITVDGGLSLGPPPVK